MNMDEDALLAAVELVGRTGAKSFEVGYLHDDVPADQAGWWANAQYRGTRITEQDHHGPVEAAEALARRLLTGAKCKCGRLVALSDAGAVAYTTTQMADGSTWTAEQAAAAGQCRWTRTGRRWRRGCEDDQPTPPGPRGGGADDLPGQLLLPRRPSPRSDGGAMTVDRDLLRQDLADHVRDLVEPRKHTEPYRSIDPKTRRVKWLAHTTSQPSLLDQLRLGGGAAAGESGSRGYESRPPNAFDCFGRLLAIEAGSAWWVSVAWRMPLREDAEGNLRAIVGKAADPAVRDVDLLEVTVDVRRWHTWASVLTGWKTPPWTPRASCPRCERRGQLRVRLDEKQATCLHCGSTWDSATLGLLAEHIRSEGESRDAPNGAGMR